MIPAHVQFRSLNCGYNLAVTVFLVGRLSNTSLHSRPSIKRAQQPVAEIGFLVPDTRHSWTGFIVSAFGRRLSNMALLVIHNKSVSLIEQKHCSQLHKRES
jgi:hypothetical protein